MEINIKNSFIRLEQDWALSMCRPDKKYLTFKEKYSGVLLYYYSLSFRIWCAGSSWMSSKLDLSWKMPFFLTLGHLKPGRKSASKQKGSCTTSLILAIEEARKHCEETTKCGKRSLPNRTFYTSFVFVCLFLSANFDC